MEEFLPGNLALGLAWGVTLAVFGWWQRSALADITWPRQQGWRRLAWAAWGAAGALLLWGSLADNWRKMLGELLDLKEPYPSQRAVLVPVAHEIRLVTFVVLALSLVTLAPLFARYAGGYVLQLTLVIIGAAAFFPLYLMRQRLDTGLAGVVSFPSVFSLDMISTLIYLLLDYAVNVALLLTFYLGLLGLVALPVTAVLDLLGRREPPAEPTTTTAAFYTTLRDHTAAQHAAAAGGQEQAPGDQHA
ncbi:MAG: hypothetical protein ACTHMP_19105 [Thermomicrobiales bacterium]